MTDQDTPKGLMLAVANAHDDQFRWRVAAAVVAHAQAILDSDTITDEDDDHCRWARYAVWHWTEVGEVFARYLAIGHGLQADASDDDINYQVRRRWDDLAAGMPAKE